MKSGDWEVPEIAALQPSKHWSDYFAGVAQGLVRAGIELHPGPVFHSQRGAGRIRTQQFRRSRGRLRPVRSCMAGASIACGLPNFASVPKLILWATPAASWTSTSQSSAKNARL